MNKNCVKNGPRPDWQAAGKSRETRKNEPKVKLRMKCVFSARAVVLFLVDTCFFLHEASIFATPSALSHHFPFLFACYTGKVVPEEALDEHEKMKRKLGNNKQLDKMTRGFVRLAKKVRKCLILSVWVSIVVLIFVHFTVQRQHTSSTSLTFYFFTRVFLISHCRWRHTPSNKRTFWRHRWTSSRRATSSASSP